MLDTGLKTENEHCILISSHTLVGNSTFAFTTQFYSHACLVGLVSCTRGTEVCEILLDRRYAFS